MNKRNTRDLGFSAAGKGDADRTTSRAAYAKNYDDINWHRGEAKPNTVANTVAEGTGGNHQLCDCDICRHWN